MLLQLNIINFALIENLTVNFSKGLNILTGETGAGKSILIDAISFVLGGKFNKDLIRSGENRTFVEAIFEIKNSKTKEILLDFEIEFDDLLIISRETFLNGKSIAKVNGKALILSQIKRISETIMDIHGQHDNQNLLYSSSHITYLDYYGEDEYGEILQKYKQNHKRFKEIDDRIIEIQGKFGEREKQIDFLKYQIDEIEKANLKLEEDVELNKKYSIISNQEKINKALEYSYGILHSSGDYNNSVLQSLSIAIKELKSIEGNIEDIKPICSSIEEAYYMLEGTTYEIQTIKDNIYVDEGELQNINQRLYQIESLKKKYGNSIEEIIQNKKVMLAQYEELVNSDAIINKLSDEKSEIEKYLIQSADQLHKRREVVAKSLEKKIKDQFNYIGLEKSIIEIDILKEDSFLIDGFDKVQFLISTNPGEPLKPLSKIVSGGELSRIMLAIKTVFVHKDSIPSIIFDEIDTGISGRVAQCVGEKMYVISREHQVLCVTHLPQIASISDSHYLITKEAKQNKTFTEIKLISEEEKEVEVARMIGGSEITKVTLENSKEMINLSNLKKYELIKS